MGRRLRYQLVALPTSGADGWADGVNSDRTVVGTVEYGVGWNAGTRPVMWVGGKVEALPGIGGEGGDASGIADNGIIYGAADTVSGAMRPVIWIGDSVVELPVPSMYSAGACYGGNNGGAAVGAVCNSFGSDERAFRSQEHSLTLLHSEDWVRSAAQGVNDQGICVGWAERSDGRSMAIRWIGCEAEPLPNLAEGNAIAWSINNAGTVVGAAAFAGSRTAAVVWRSGAVLPLAPMAERSFAFDVNDREEVVGNMLLPGHPDSTGHAFIYSDLGLMDLGEFAPLGWAFTEARSINNRGDIAGWGRHWRRSRPFLLLRQD